MNWLTLGLYWVHSIVTIITIWICCMDHLPVIIFISVCCVRHLVIVLNFSSVKM
jgi:hypothetical protein